MRRKGKEVLVNGDEICVRVCGCAVGRKLVKSKREYGEIE